MNTLRTLLQGMGLPVLVLCLLGQPALAQKSNAVVTIEKSDGDETVVVKIEDGKRTVTVNGEVLSDEEADEYLDKMDVLWVDDDDGYVWRVGPQGRRFRLFGDKEGEFLADFHTRMNKEWPQIYFSDRDAEGENTFYLDDQLHGLRDGLAAFGKDALTIRMDVSMKEQAEIARMDMESRRLAMKIRKADEEERAELEQELRDQLEEIFERKEALRAERVEALREQLDEAAAARQERQQNRQEIIERRMKELLGERGKYDW